MCTDSFCPSLPPPLRERTGDIPALVQHFVERKARQLKLGHTPILAEGAIEVLTAYSWPGNVHELEDLVERAMIVCRDEPLRFDLGDPSRHVSASTGPVPVDEEDEFQSLDDVVARHIRNALELSNGKIHGSGGAGELLGMNPNTLRVRMRKLKIPFTKKNG